MTLYGADLAFIHDAGFVDLADAATRMVLDLEPPPGRAVDLGCGGGSLLRGLADAGFEPWGLDVSPAMIELARQRVPEGSFRVADALEPDLALPACSVVTAVGEVFNYALADHSPHALEALLGCVRGALAPGGVFLFDVATPGRAGDGPTHAERRGRTWRVEASAVEQDGWLTRTIESWRLVNDGWTQDREVHRLRLLDPAWVLEALRAAGFEDVERLGGYDDFAFQPGWDGFLARP